MSEGISPLWLAGFFEAGGTVTFETSASTYHGRQYRYGYPLLMVTEKELDYLTNLSDIIPSKQPRRRSDSSNVWRLKGHAAAELIAQFGQYAPSRVKALEAVQNWSIADLHERYEIAKEVIGSSTPICPQSEAYQDLVQDRDFVAGVVDQRGLASLHNNKGCASPSLRLISTNLGLCEALHRVWGGSVSINSEAGDEIKIQGRRIILVRNSYTWFLERDDTSSLYLAIKDHMHIRGVKFDSILKV